METLREILINSSDDDLQLLIEYQKNESRFKGINDKHTKVSAIIDEIRLNGGNTFANLVRGKGVEYDEVVGDVAKQLNIKFDSSFTTDNIEFEIIKRLVMDEFEKMSPEQKKELLENLGAENIDNIIISPALLAGLLAAKLSGFVIYKLTLITANAIARTVLGHGLKLTVNASIMRGVSVALGPVGWVVSGAWLAFDLAGPAFRKTVPI